MGIVLLFFINSVFSVNSSSEHVALERNGQMSGTTSFIHVHVTLVIGLITKQTDTYRHLLNTTFWRKRITDENVLRQ